MFIVTIDIHQHQISFDQRFAVFLWFITVIQISHFNHFVDVLNSFLHPTLCKFSLVW